MATCEPTDIIVILNSVKTNCASIPNRFQEFSRNWIHITIVVIIVVVFFTALNFRNIRQPLVLY
jgi:hypothetical protein